jgi:hypothetical protein
MNLILIWGVDAAPSLLCGVLDQPGWWNSGLAGDPVQVVAEALPGRVGVPQAFALSVSKEIRPNLKADPDRQSPGARLR